MMAYLEVEVWMYDSKIDPWSSWPAADSIVGVVFNFNERGRQSCEAAAKKDARSHERKETVNLDEATKSERLHIRNSYFRAAYNLAIL